MRIPGKNLTSEDPIGAGGGDGLDGVLLDLQEEVAEVSHHSPPHVQQLEGDIPNYRGRERGVWRQTRNKTSVSYAGPILTGFYRIHGLLLTRIEDPGPARLGPNWLAAEDAAGVFAKSSQANAKWLSLNSVFCLSVNPSGGCEHTLKG